MVSRHVDYGLGGYARHKRLQLWRNDYAATPATQRQRDYTYSSALIIVDLDSKTTAERKKLRCAQQKHDSIIKASCEDVSFVETAP